MTEDSPRAVVGRLYELISGPAEQERLWDAVQDLFHTEGILYSELTLPDGTHQSGRWTVEEFCAAAASEYRKTGFWEREIAAREERFGAIAHIWSTYESRVGSEDSDPVGRGINSVSLLRQDGCWRITSIVFQIERGTEGMPDRYLGGESAVEDVDDSG